MAGLGGGLPGCPQVPGRGTVSNSLTCGPCRLAFKPQRMGFRSTRLLFGAQAMTPGPPTSPEILSRLEVP